MPTLRVECTPFAESIKVLSPSLRLRYQGWTGPVEYTTKDKRLYLRLGDRVTHICHEEWGEGVVVEERTSVVPGGTCLVRLLFEDGQQRTFNNDMDHEQCGYFFGLRRLWSFDIEQWKPARAERRGRVRRDRRLSHG